MIEYYDKRLDVQNGNIGILSAKEKELLRNLGFRVKEIAEQPCQQNKICLWKKHNSLKKEKPIVLTYPEGAWQEMIPYDKLSIKDPFWRSYEYYLKRLIYRGERIRDDNAIEAVIEVPLVYKNSGWGLEPTEIRKTSERGAAAWEPALNHLDDIGKLNFPMISVDEEKTRRNADAVGELLADILPVKIYRRIDIDTSLIERLVRWRGTERLMLDMVDNADWLHSIMEIMKNGTISLMDYIEDNYILDPNNGNDYVGSGGLGYTDELPISVQDGKKTCFCNMWGFSESQDYDIISPAMYDEFAVQYQIPLLERYGLNCYGCCESLNKKFDIIKKIPRLRRVSISPWTDPAIAAEALEDKYILSWKPNPAQLVGAYDRARLKEEIKRVLEVTKGCVMEMILKDTHTIEHHPERIEEWVDIAQELASNGYK